MNGRVIALRHSSTAIGGLKARDGHVTVFDAFFKL